MIAINQPVRLGDRVADRRRRGDRRGHRPHIHAPAHARQSAGADPQRGARQLPRVEHDDGRPGEPGPGAGHGADHGRRAPACARCCQSWRRPAPGALVDRPGPGVSVADLTGRRPSSRSASGGRTPPRRRTTAAWLRERALARLHDEGVLAALEEETADERPGPEPRDAYDDVLGHVAARRRKRRADRPPARPPVGRRHGAHRDRDRVRRRSSHRAASARRCCVSDVLKGVRLEDAEAALPGSHHPHLRPQRQPARPDPVDREPDAGAERARSRRGSSRRPSTIEDKRFYEHGGVDYQGVLRAALDNLQAGQSCRARSTIEQQLVRNLYLIGRAVVHPQDPRGLPGDADVRPLDEGPDPHRRT